MACSTAAILSHDQRQTFRAATRFEKLIQRCFINVEAEIFEFSASHRATRVHDDVVAAYHGVASKALRLVRRHGNEIRNMRFEDRFSVIVKGGRIEGRNFVRERAEASVE